MAFMAQLSTITLVLPMRHEKAVLPFSCFTHAVRWSEEGAGSALE